MLVTMTTLTCLSDSLPATAQNPDWSHTERRRGRRVINLRWSHSLPDLPGPASSLTRLRPMEIGRKVWWNVNQISLMNWVELDCRISSDSRDGGLEEMKKTVVAGGFICLSQSQPARPLITNNYQSKQQISTRGGDTTHKDTRKQGPTTESVQTLS